MFRLLVPRLPIKTIVRHCEILSDLTAEILKDIYCRGELLHYVQLLHVFPDSKTYVDKKMRFDPEQVLDNFDKLKEATPVLTAEILEEFMDENFEPEHGFEVYIPPDWTPNPKFIDGIIDPHLRQFALDVHNLWRTLGRRFNDDVRANANRYSLLYTPKPFVIPGGRFREFYYWDSYWIIRGLILSEMYDTAKNMMENYLYLVDRYGIIPNGGRIYYTDRSQPPMLSRMIETYMDATQDAEFLFHAIPIIEKEFFFWREKRSVLVEKDGKQYLMFHYSSESTTPRPESYREDYEWAQKLPEAQRPQFYREVRAAAESGIDFSGRWWIPPYKSNDSSPFTDISTTQIIPVDLNSILQRNAVILSKFFDMIGVRYKALFYKDVAKRYEDAIMQILWHEDVGSWLDYDYVHHERREKFYPSNLAPLWSNSYPKDKNIPDKVVKFLNMHNIIRFNGGIPASTEHTGQQWDYPNAWAPHQDMVISGLGSCDSENAQVLAKILAKNWISRNYLAYKQDHVMYEKYSAYMIQTGGGGGEYENQVGFGWSNGVLLDLMDRYQDFSFPE